MVLATSCEPTARKSSFGGSVSGGGGDSEVVVGVAPSGIIKATAIATFAKRAIGAILSTRPAGVKWYYWNIWRDNGK